MNNLMVDIMAEAAYQGTLIAWWLIGGCGIVALAWWATWPIRKAVRDEMAKGVSGVRRGNETSHAHLRIAPQSFWWHYAHDALRENGRSIQN